jgi:hypothetical protein
MLELIQNGPSGRRPVPADGFFGPSHEMKTGNVPVFNSSLDTSSSLPPFRQGIRLLAAPLPAGTGSTSILRTMLPNSRRVRWLSASSNQ